MNRLAVYEHSEDGRGIQATTTRKMHDGSIRDAAVSGSGLWGQPPAFELECTDFVDNDCDGAIDCADTDCAPDPVCSVPACEPRGALCSGDVDCCSGKCRNGACRG